MRLLHQAPEPDAVTSISSLAGHTLLENVAWLDANWMFLGLFGGVLVFSWLLSSHWPGSLRDKLHNPVWCAYLSTAFYSIHQFEEHGYDIFGRRYMFVPVFNAGTGVKLGLELLPRVVTLVNIFSIWVVLPFWARMATKENGFYTATLPWGFAVVNGLNGHIVPFFIDEGELRYVPGAIQSVFMVPLGIWILLVVFKQEGLILGTVLPLVYGGLCHLIGIILPMLFLTSVSENIRFPLCLCLTGLLPVLLAANPTFQNMLSQMRGKARLA